jgi:hypothetical protein
VTETQPESVVPAAGHAAGLWTHTPVDWRGNEGVAKPANWPTDAVNGNPGNGTRPGSAMPPPGLTILSATPGVASGTVTWTTSVASDSTVNYGPTTSYNKTVNDPTMVTAHSVALTGLTSGQVVHYSVTSSGGGYSASSVGDSTFTPT